METNDQEHSERLRASCEGDKMGGPLEGLVIADFTQLAQGPFSTQMLGDMGAEIIKIEPPKGDWMRHWSMANLFLEGEGASFLSFNRNKRSIALDLKNPAGKEVALRLIGAADIAIENFRPGVMERLGLGYETLAEKFPRLIYCASSGWGQTGPYLTRPGQDLLVQAVAGVGYLNGNADGPPQGVAVGIADFTAGFHIVYGVLAALYARERTGKGQRVDVNLLNSILNLHIQEISLFLNGAGLPVRSNSDIPGAYLGAPYGFYQTADGYIAIAMNPVNKLAALVGVPGYEDRTESQIMEGRDRIRADFQKGFIKKTTQGWLDILLPEDIWCAPVNDYEAVEKDPQIAENEMIVEWKHPKAGNVRGVGIPVKFSRTPGEIARHAPLLGEHTVELLKQYAGYGDEEIDALLKQGVVSQLDMTGAPVL
jgi:crotonobetainyl-CoA:carnitine CoA-transferase CaiB-like acyl-CoA transferase